MKTCVIIPTYNEAKNIAEVVNQVHDQNLDVVIVDDGSRDATPEIARANGAVILANETNKGKGASLVKGFHYALGNDYDAVVTMDGDGQHHPADIPYFIRLAAFSDSGVIIGNRMSKTMTMPWSRLMTNKLMSWLLSAIIKQKVPDTQCGFRLIKRAVLEKMILKTRKYEIESEVLIRAAHLGFKIESVPINTIYKGTKSQINPFLDTLRFIKFIAKEIWDKP